MNTGQMFMAIGAMIILSLLTITINSSILSSADVSQRSEFTITANGILQSILEEARSKAFDLATVNNPDAKVQDFTGAGSLGPAFGETYPNFNDFDDYNGLDITVATPRAGNFRVTATVTYVNPDSPDNAVNYRTHAKRITVQVTNPYMKDTMRGVYVASF